MLFTYTEYRNELITLAGILITVTRMHDSGYISKKANRPIRLGESFKKRATHIHTLDSESLFSATLPRNWFSVQYGCLKCYYRPTASLQLNNKRNTKYNITVT